MSGHDMTAHGDVNCELTLQFPPPSLSPSPTPRPTSPARPSSNHVPSNQPAGAAASPSAHHHDIRPPQPRRNPTQRPRRLMSETIPPPFPWAGDRRATVRSLVYLRAMGITEVHGETQCRHCEARATVTHDLVAKYEEVAGFIYSNAEAMKERWTKEMTFPGCNACNQSNCMKPVIAPRKRSINWLFLFLGQWVGCCTLDQLKYFCKHTRNHRTGAKDRVLFLSYISIFSQLNQHGP